jgi:ribosome-interacting GTPase 1
MKNIFFIIIIFLLNHKTFSSTFWVCPNNYGSDFEYNIVNKQVYIKKNNKWLLLYNNKVDKIEAKERIIYISAKTNKNILTKEIFDLKKLTIQIYSRSKDDNHSFELMSTRQCSLP